MEQITQSPWCTILQWTDKNGHFHEAPLDDVNRLGKVIFEEDDNAAREIFETDGTPSVTLAGLCESRAYMRWHRKMEANY